MSSSDVFEPQRLMVAEVIGVPVSIEILRRGDTLELVPEELI